MPSSVEGKVRTRWLKIPLIVAAAFGFTILAEGLVKASAQTGTPSLWAILVLPGRMIVPNIAANLRTPLLMWFDIDGVPQALIWWIHITFNTLFYGGLFWLISLFVTEARQPETRSTKASVKAITARVLLAAAISLLLGMGAIFLYLAGTCLFGGTHCPDYSPTKIWLAFLLAPPIFLTQPSFFQASRSISSPAMMPIGCVLLWAYYFGLVSAARLGIRRFRRVAQPSASVSL